MKPNACSQVCLSIFLGLLFAAAADAGQAAGGEIPLRPNSNAQAPAQPPSSQPPPVVQFEPQGVALAEAVRLTLQHSPTLQLAESAARQQDGVAQEQSGAFDTSFLGGGNYDYRRQRLTESTILGETLKRENLAAARDENRLTSQNLQRLQTQLRAIQSTPIGAAQLEELKKLDPVTAANLRMIDAFGVGNFGGAALQQNLNQIRQDLINDTVANAQTGIAAAESAFAQLSQIVTNLGAAPIQEYFLNGGGDARLSKFFRNGIQLAPFVDGKDSYSNFVDKPFGSEFGGKGIFPLYTFRGGLNITVPLARGLGYDATAGPERFSLINAQAGRLEVDHEAAQSALDTITAYWNLRAAQDGVAIAQQSVDLQIRMVDLTRGSIAVGDLAQIELARVQASEARSRADLRDAERSRHEARVRLATVMGIATTDDEATLPLARDPFPAAPEPADANEQRILTLVASAVPQRRDVEAATRRQEAASVLMRSETLNLKPKIDLIGESFFTALDEEVVTRALGRWVGPSYKITVDVEKPFGNNTAKGRLVQAQAGSATSQITSQDLQRQVRLNVVRIARSLNEAIERVKQAQASVAFYQQIIESELELFRLGEVTLIDTITTESQQTDARRVLVGAQQDVAQLIAELRFQTGTLVRTAGAPITPDTFVTVPK